MLDAKPLPIESLQAWEDQDQALWVVLQGVSASSLRQNPSFAKDCCSWYEQRQYICDCKPLEASICPEIQYYSVRFSGENSSCTWDSCKSWFLS